MLLSSDQEGMALCSHLCERPIENDADPRTNPRRLFTERTSGYFQGGLSRIFGLDLDEKALHRDDFRPDRARNRMDRQSHF
jgi:hypothetical protein